MPNGVLVIIKSVLLFFAVILLVRLFGRRWVAGRTGWDRIIAVVVAIIAAGISVNLIPLVQGIFALITWGLLTIAINFLILKSKAIRDLLEGREIVVVQHGKVLEDNLKEARMTPEDFLRQLRTKNVFQVADVEFAVMEADGEINLLLKSDQRPITPRDFGKTTAPTSAPQTVMLDGNILDEGLTNLGLNRAWLMKEIDKIGIAPENVLIAQVDSHGDLYVDLFDDAIQVPKPSTRKLLESNLQMVEANLMNYVLETQDEAAKMMYEDCLRELKKVERDLKPLLR